MKDTFLGGEIPYFRDPVLPKLIHVLSVFPSKLQQNLCKFGKLFFSVYLEEKIDKKSRQFLVKNDGGGDRWPFPLKQQNV